MSLGRAFAEISNRVSHATGRPATFALAVAVIAVWAVTGPLFGFSDTWQPIVNTGTTVVTFLMVFLIQNTQNRDGAAIQAKLGEPIRACAGQNAFIGIEHLTQDELDEIRARREVRARAESAADRARDGTNRKAARAAQEVTS